MSCSPIRRYQSAEDVTWESGDEKCPVSVFTEWDPLEEVLVGILDDVRVPEWDAGLAAVIPRHARAFFQQNVNRHFPKDQVDAARKELDFLAHLLNEEGVTVRRPERMDHRRPVVTPHFQVAGGFHSAMPRDCLLAVGTKIIEAPMAWKSRYFETFAYRKILKDYFMRGAQWIAAPKPMLSDELWDSRHDPDGATFSSVITEFEPVFDAADFMKIGRDLIGQRSHVTNSAGIAWLRRSLGPDYDIHIYAFDDAAPMHIDTTILPLAPGKVLVNPAWVSRLPDLFKHWDVLHPPVSSIPDTFPLYMTSKWIHCNVLMLDERRVVVEKDETALIQAFRSWGFDPIPCPFRNFQSFGGSFHCATLDVRRAGELRRYI